MKEGDQIVQEVFIYVGILDGLEMRFDGSMDGSQRDEKEIFGNGRRRNLFEGGILLDPMRPKKKEWKRR